jgi:hypothetical protein
MIVFFCIGYVEEVEFWMGGIRALGLYLGTQSCISGLKLEV